MAPKYGILRGYLRRLFKNLMTLTSRYSVAFWTMNDCHVLSVLKCLLSIARRSVYYRRIQELKLGGQGRTPKARAESRRQEGWGVERECLLPHREVPLPRNFFGDFRVKMAYFRGLFVLNFVFFLWPKQYRNNLEYKDCHGDWLACDKERVYSSKSLEQVSPNSKWGAAGVDRVGNGERVSPP